MRKIVVFLVIQLCLAFNIQADKQSQPKGIVIYVNAGYPDWFESSLSREGLSQGLDKATQMLREFSYGKFAPAFDVCSAEISYTADASNRAQIFKEAVQACDPEVHFSEYQWIILYIRAPIGHEARDVFDITTDEGLLTKEVIFLGWGARFNIIVHEIGHALGLSHAASVLCEGSVLDSDCDGYLESDLYDLMGPMNMAPHKPMGHFNCFSKSQLGWLKPQEHGRLDSPQLLSIAPIEVVSQGVPQCIAVPLGRGTVYFPNYRKVSNPCQSLYIEYRQPIGFDRNIPLLSKDGLVLIHCATREPGAVESPKNMGLSQKLGHSWLLPCNSDHSGIELGDSCKLDFGYQVRFVRKKGENAVVEIRR